MRILLLLLLSLNCHAQIIQSHDITAIYGESIASYSGRITLYKIRNTALDTYDNTPHIINNILQKYNDDDNLTLIGFDDNRSIKVFDKAYSEHVETVVKQFRKSEIDTFCNTLCLQIGKVHKVITVRQLRKALFDINPTNTVVISLTSLWDEDRKRWIYLDDVTKIFKQSENFLVSPLYFDNTSHLHFKIGAQSIHLRKLKIETRINLNGILQLPDANDLLNVTEKLNIKAK